MPEFMRLAWESVGYDKARNSFVMGQNTTARFFLKGGGDGTVSVDDGSIATATLGSEANKAGHKIAQVDNAISLRPVLIKSGTKLGRTSMSATDGTGQTIAGPLSIYVVDNKQGRRITDKAMDAEIRTELDGLSLREAVVRVAEDQIHSDIVNDVGGAKGAARYHLEPSYGTQWCGKFVHWCWQRACDIKKVANPYGPSAETFLSPQKAISWGMRPETNGQLLQYSGPDPMGAVKGTQELRDIGWNGHNLEPGDLALWRNKSTGKFQHVSFVKSVNGNSFVDINGNAYDAGSGSAFAILRHDDMRAKINRTDYRCFFLHVVI